MGSNAADRVKELYEGIDDKTLLQVNASMIIGILFFLSLSSLMSGFSIPTQTSGPSVAAARFLTFYFTIIAIIPFVVSASIVLYVRGEPHKWVRQSFARGLTIMGFASVVALLALFAYSVYPDIKGDVDQQCAKDPETFNVSTNPWKCSQFTIGSLAEQCAKDPESFNISKSNCSEFIPPSSI